MKDSFAHFHPSANATFYWAVAILIAAIYVAVFVSIRFDYWEVRPNELLHHHGMLSDSGTSFGAEPADRKGDQRRFRVLPAAVGAVDLAPQR